MLDKPYSSASPLRGGRDGSGAPLLTPDGPASPICKSEFASIISVLYTPPPVLLDSDRTAQSLSGV
jgi:hypothetical protein